MPSLVGVSLEFLEKKKFVNFVNVFSIFGKYLPLEKGRTLHLNKLESPSAKDALFKVQIGSVVLEKNMKM